MIFEYFVNGSLLNEFIYCKNKIIFIKNKIKQAENINIKIGNIYDEDNKKIRIGNIEIDGIDKKNKLIIELKKNMKNLDGDRFQCLFYLYYLKNIYKDYKCKIIYKENEKEEIIELNKKNEKLLISKIKELENHYISGEYNKNLIDLDKKCRGCGFLDYCINF